MVEKMKKVKEIDKIKIVLNLKLSHLSRNIFVIVLKRLKSSKISCMKFIMVKKTIIL